MVEHGHVRHAVDFCTQTVTVVTQCHATVILFTLLTAIALTAPKPRNRSAITDDDDQRGASQDDHIWFTKQKITGTQSIFGQPGAVAVTREEVELALWTRVGQPSSETSVTMPERNVIETELVGNWMLMKIVEDDSETNKNSWDY